MFNFSCGKKKLCFYLQFLFVYTQAAILRHINHIDMSKRKTSEKINLIDRKTYDKLQEHQNTTAQCPQARRIRNSKYKKTRAGAGATASGAVSLLQFLRPSGSKQQLKKKKRLQVARLPINRTKELWKKRGGKTREGGKRKKYSRLKKSILRYRLLKQEQRDNINLISETEESMRNLKIGETPKSQPMPIAVSETAAIVHSRRFRPYCDNCTTPLLAKLTDQLIRELNRFQRRAFTQNEIKARAHRRFVVGFREAQAFLRINKVKLLIIAPDCEECEGETGIDKTIEDIKIQCQSQNIPYVFTLRRRQLAYALFKKVPVSCVAVLDYDGTREIYAQLMEALQQARQEYNLLRVQLNGNVQQDNSTKIETN